MLLLMVREAWFSAPIVWEYESNIIALSRDDLLVEDQVKFKVFAKITGVFCYFLSFAAFLSFGVNMLLYFPIFLLGLGLTLFILLDNILYSGEWVIIQLTIILNGVPSLRI